MDLFRTILLNVENRVAWLQMNRAEAHNTINLTMAKELCRALNQCDATESIRAIVLSGSGNIFSGGGDVKAFAESVDDKVQLEMLLKDLCLYTHAFVSEIARTPKLTISAVNGVAAGAGFAASLACDMTVASEDAEFISAYTGIGLTPDSGMSYHLSRLVGMKRAKEIIYLNEPIYADEALRLGIVNRVFPADEYEDGLKSLVQRLASGPIKAYGRSKTLLQQGNHETLETQLENERRAVAESARGEELEDGIKAFIEKRKPKF